MKGILLDYIEGCSLDDIVHRFPRSTWQTTVDEALGIVHTMDMMKLLNEDVAEWNCIVSGASDSAGEDNERETAKPRVQMIDLAMCRARRADKSDGDWGRAKHHAQEEVFALAMKQYWKRKQNFDLDFEMAYPYGKYSDTLCDACGRIFVRYDHVCPNK